jgi:hypothetical protein
MRSKQSWIDPLRAYVGRDFDGLWIEVLTLDDPEVALRRVEGALALIKSYDQLRYRRITRDLRRVRVHQLFGTYGSYVRSRKSCDLDLRFVTDETTALEVIASVIVHEATHARLRRCRIEFEDKLRARIEAVCIRRELTFASRLPNGKQVRAWAESRLEWYAVPEFLTDAAREQRFSEAYIAAAREVGIPGWLVSAGLAMRRTMLAFRAACRSAFAWCRPR